MNNRERRYIVFVPSNEINEDKMEHFSVIQWGYDNLKHENVLQLSLSDIYLLQYQSCVLDFINDENKGMLQAGEDDWIISEDKKISINKKLTNYLSEVSNPFLIHIIKRLIKLIELSINTKKNIYFIF